MQAIVVVVRGVLRGTGVTARSPTGAQAWVGVRLRLLPISSTTTRQVALDASCLVVVDEIGSNLNLTPTHAWAPVGERAVTPVPRNTPLTTTTIACMTDQGIGPSLIVS